MNAVDYLRQRERMCNTEDCPGGCDYDFDTRRCHMDDLEASNPSEAVEIVRRWAEAHPVEGGIRLTAMERRFAQIYIEKGYLWAAREKNGRLMLYKRCPEREDGRFTSTSPIRYGSREVFGDLMLSVTWENSPVLLPKLIEEE